MTPAAGVEPLDTQAPPEAWNGAGLLSVVSTPGGRAGFLLPATEGLVPPWCAQPDESGKSRLLTLAQELGMVLLPEEFFPDGFTTQWVENLAAAVTACGLADGVQSLSLAVSHDDQAGTLWLVWPLAAAASPSGAAKETTPAAEVRPASDPAASSPPAVKKTQERILYDRIEDVLPCLPVYSRSLLKIRTSVRVTLASTRLSVRQILELAPGSLIQFQKAYDEPLDLEVGAQRVAQGEAVKIGEKFGLRITAIVLPSERFVPVTPKRTAG